MKYAQIAEKLRDAGIAFEEYESTWFWGDSGEIGEELTGIFVMEQEDWERALDVLNIDKEKAMDALSTWEDYHETYKEGYPIRATYICKENPESEDGFCNLYNGIDLTKKDPWIR